MKDSFVFFLNGVIEGLYRGSLIIVGSMLAIAVGKFVERLIEIYKYEK